MWAELATVVDDSVEVTEDGHSCEVEIKTGGFEECNPYPARVACLYPGFYLPIAGGEEVLAVAPSGDPSGGLVVFPRLWSTMAPPPTEAVVDPDQIWLVSDGQINLKSTAAPVNIRAVQEIVLQGLEVLVNGTGPTTDLQVGNGNDYATKAAALAAKLNTRSGVFAIHTHGGGAVCDHTYAALADADIGDSKTKING